MPYSTKFMLAFISPKDWQSCLMHRFYKGWGLGSICLLWGQIQVRSSKFLTGSGNLEPLMRMPASTASQGEELKRTECAGRLPCVPPEPQQAHCCHHWTTEDPRQNPHTKWDAAEWHSPGKKIGGKINAMIPDG